MTGISTMLTAGVSGASADNAGAPGTAQPGWTFGEGSHDDPLCPVFRAGEDHAPYLGRALDRAGGRRPPVVLVLHARGEPVVALDGQTSSVPALVVTRERTSQAHHPADAAGKGDLMSRYELEPKSAHHMVTVGWDAPMGSFFLQVIDRQHPEYDRPVVALGASGRGAERTPDRVLRTARDYAHVPDNLRGQLLADRQREPQNLFSRRLADGAVKERKGWRVTQDAHKRGRRRGR